MQVNASVDEYKNESKNPNSALKSKTEKKKHIILKTLPKQNTNLLEFCVNLTLKSIILYHYL